MDQAPRNPTSQEMTTELDLHYPDWQSFSTCRKDYPECKEDLKDLNLSHCRLCGIVFTDDHWVKVHVRSVHCPQLLGDVVTGKVEPVGGVVDLKDFDVIGLVTEASKLVTEEKHAAESVNIHAVDELDPSHPGSETHSRHHP